MPSDPTASHEVAHLWFYGLVGDDQARDPWLDEAFATYAEALDRGTGPAYERTTVPADGRGRTGAPMTYWEGRDVLLPVGLRPGRRRAAPGPPCAPAPPPSTARSRATSAAPPSGSSTPADLAASLRHLPAALAELRRAGAL